MQLKEEYLTVKEEVIKYSKTVTLVGNIVSNKRKIINKNKFDIIHQLNKSKYTT